ncbi:MAG: BON domain-containing protein [Pirellulaceae bacterium]|nr:BON domain-containing protein [Pirellulaceae bacterium]
MCGQDESSEGRACCLTTLVRRRLHSCGYAALKSVECTHESGVLTLRGSVASFYLKQVAQERIRTIEGITRICNELEVQYNECDECSN